MKRLNCSDWFFIENALMYFAIHEIREMKKHPESWSDKDVSEFSASVRKLMDKVSKIKEGE